MSKFSIFKPIDAITFGGVSLIVSGLTVYAAANGTTGKELIILILTALCFWGIYGGLILMRKNFMNKISFITKHQIAVITNEFTIDKEVFENITDDLIQRWQTATGYTGCAKSLEGIYVIFKPYPITHNSSLGKFAGYFIGTTAVVGYKEDLKTTALFHELGHRIHEVWTGKADNEASHKYMTEHHLG